MTGTPFACTRAKEDVKTHYGAAWYSFPCDPLGRDDYANVRLVAPQGFSLGSHVILDGLESYTARDLKQAVGLESSCAVFPVLLHNSSLKSFLCNYGVRALASCGYSSVVGQPPGFVSPRPRPRLVATRSQHSMHSLKKKQKKTQMLILRMFEVMHRVAKLSCDYVKRGAWSSLGFDKC